MIANNYLTNCKWLFFIGLFHFACSHSFAQGKQQYIVLSGIIVDGDSAYGIAGVHVYIEQAKVGTVSNQLGYFSMPAQVGDTVVFSAVSYKKHKIIVPKRDDAAISLLVNLQNDTTILPVVEIFPYPTIEIFEEAFLALELPNAEKKLEENLNKDLLYRMSLEVGMGGAANHRYFMDQQINHVSNKYFNPTYSFLNPFAWAQFIKSLKKNKNKKK